MQKKILLKGYFSCLDGFPDGRFQMQCPSCFATLPIEHDDPKNFFVAHYIDCFGKKNEMKSKCDICHVKFKSADAMREHRY